MSGPPRPDSHNSLSDKPGTIQSMKMGLRVVGLARIGSFEVTHNPKVAGSNPAPATKLPQIPSVFARLR